MSRNYLSEFSREEIKIGEEDEEIVSLNKRTPTEETISYQRITKEGERRNRRS